MALQPEARQFPEGLTSLPMELEQFLSRDSGSLLIKGSAGTGKTTLALTILRALDVRKNFMYLSTRTSIQHFFEYYPWLRAWILGPQKKPTKEESEVSDIPRSFVDARLDEPTQLFERITGELMDAREPVIVIDTWDSLEKFTEGESLDADMRVLQAWCERANARLILIKEDMLDTSFDSVVDAVVTLKQGELEGRRTREIGFTKLYGVNIENPSYFFTLKDGRFHAFERFREEDFIKLATASRRPAPTRGGLEDPVGYSTGHRELDSVIGGGIPLGALLNLELAPEVHSRTGLTLLVGLMTAAAMAGQRVLLFPFHGLDETFATGLVRNSILPSKRKFVSQFWPATSSSSSSSSPAGGRERSASRRRAPAEKTFEEHMQTACRKDGNSSSVLAILGPDRFAANAEMGMPLTGFASTIQSCSGAGVVVTRESDNSFSRDLSILGALHLRATWIKGTLLVQPQRPLSKFFAAELRREATGARLELEPMI